MAVVSPYFKRSMVDVHVKCHEPPHWHSPSLHIGASHQRKLAAVDDRHTGRQHGQDADQ